MRIVELHIANAFPVWRRPVALLILMAAAMPLALSTWHALLNNFVIETAGFTGV
ncbi:MAG: MFS transporter, partial [Pseudomonadota bacterium]